MDVRGVFKIRTGTCSTFFKEIKKASPWEWLFLDLKTSVEGGGGKVYFKVTKG